MATYLELLALTTDAALLNRTQIAVLVAADAVRVDGLSSPAPENQAARMAWASKALTQPQIEAQRALACVLAQNRALSVAQINAASDAALQSAVDAAVDLLSVR